MIRYHFKVSHPFGEFIGIVETERASSVAAEAIARHEWGTRAAYKQLTAAELRDAEQSNFTILTVKG